MRSNTVFMSNNSGIYGNWEEGLPLGEICIRESSDIKVNTLLKRTDYWLSVKRTGEDCWTYGRTMFKKYRYRRQGLGGYR